jgi:hypothetical protein
MPRLVDGWWWVAVPAVVVSQIVIIMSWSDARIGSLANVLLALAAGYGYPGLPRPGFRETRHVLPRPTLRAAWRGGACTSRWRRSDLHFMLAQLGIPVLACSVGD